MTVLDSIPISVIVILFLLAIPWIFLPFVVFLIKASGDRNLKEQEKMTGLLMEIRDLHDPEYLEQLELERADKRSKEVQLKLAEEEAMRLAAEEVALRLIEEERLARYEQAIVAEEKRVQEETQRLKDAITVVQCPKCQETVIVQDLRPEVMHKCPFCRSKFTMLLDQLPPEQIQPSENLSQTPFNKIIPDPSATIPPK